MLRQIPSLCYWVLFSLLAGMSLVQASDSAAPKRAGVLTLTSGDSVAGQFCEVSFPTTICWQGKDFTRPFEFQLSGVQRVQFPAAEEAPTTGDCLLELHGGDLIYGNLVSWNPSWIELQTAQFGHIQIRATALRRITFLDEKNNLLLPGMAGIRKWLGEKSKWHDDGTGIWTDIKQAELTRDVGLPERAIIEFEISWRKQADFVLALGVPDKTVPLGNNVGWRFETWSNSLNLVCERDSVADLTPVETLAQPDRRIHLVAYLDQLKGEMTVFHPDGRPAAELILPKSKATNSANARPLMHSAVRLVNRRGDVRLEQLSVRRWNGTLPLDEASGLTRFELKDQEELQGQIESYQADSRELTLKVGDETRQVNVKELTGIEFSGKPVPAISTISLQLQDGVRLSGVIDSFSADAVTIVCPHIVEPLRVPYQSLLSLTVHPQPDQPRPPASRLPRLEIGQHQLPGALIDGVEMEDASCLVWQPVGSRTASPLRRGAAGKVIFHETVKPPSQSSTSGNGRVNEPNNMFAKLFLQKTDRPTPGPRKTADQLLHLRTGDKLPCTVLSIDEEGVHIKSSVAEATFVPHDKIKALELITGMTLPDLNAAKKERLLTLPRLQKTTPPTQILCSKAGDMLRCRLLGMNQRQLRVEIHLDEMEIPQDRVAQIIWLHPDEIATTGAAAMPSGNEPTPPEPAAASKNDEPVTPRPTQPEPAPSALESAVLVQVLGKDGNRVTFEPREVQGGTLAGTSTILGPCRYELKQAEQVIFGKEIAAAAAVLPFGQWRLQAAIEPLVAQDLPSGGGDAVSSPLIGKPAPDINLELLQGGRFELSKQRGQVIVLDFWASWCGPCMQTMPLLHQMLHEFESQPVQLVSVNLEEPAQQIRTVLERHQLELTVALDIDGVAARRYEANAIPQVVVVDRTGKVSHVFVGGGPGMIERLKAALLETLAATEK
ncbi:TlpA family protein disulfide reductase [Planctomicrobium piriforme]|nr:TlpA disulfide reductase family protein [Planctomicrobium piriforme]